MKLSKLDLTGVEDVTAQLGEDNAAENRLYRLVSKDGKPGEVIKVKARELAGTPFGMRVIVITASACDAAGRALAYGSGWRIGPEHRLTVHANPDAPSFADQVELARRRQAVLLGAIVALEAAPSDGVGTYAA